GTDTSNRHEDHADRTIGDLGGNGYSGTVGVRSASRTLDTAKSQQSTIRSQVSSAAGNVTIVAGDNVTVHGADVSAGGDLKVTGRNVLLDAGQDAERSHQTESSSQYGVTLAMSGYAVSIAQSVEQAGRAVEQHKDPRVAALYLAQAAAMAYNATQSGANSNTTGAGASNVPSAQTQTQAQSSTIIKATVSIGGSSSSSESNASAALNQGSTLRAGQNVTITATGKDASGHVVDGDIVARGSSISGRNVSLDAARDITLESRQDNTHQDSKNSGSNASIGVGLGVGGNQTGFTLELAAGFNRAHADGDAVTHVNSSVNAADTLTLNAGRDANLRGAQASGNTVNATVGRNLNVESRQDIDNYASRSESGGAQVSLCIPPFCIGSTVSGSANLAEGRTDSTYASVVHQSGIAAGTGGYNINVKGNTDLVGGVISSTADPSKNTLRTGTLTTRDVENHAAYSSEQSSVSASYTSGNPLNPDGVPTPLQQGVSNLASNAVGNAQGPIAGNASGTTRSAISTGTVVITDNAGQLAKTGKDAEATVAGLNRDTEHANDGAIGKIFDKQKIEEQQEIARLQAQVVQQVAPLLYKQVGNFLEKQPTEVRVAVHALVGGLISRAMGGEFAAGAAGAGVATLAMETVGKELESSDTLRQLPEKDRKALMQLVSGAIGGIVAGAVSGSGSAAAAAGATSQMAEQFNRQLHKSEKDAIHEAAHGDKAKEDRLTKAACYRVQCWAQYSPNSPEYLANLVEPEDAKGLVKELAWVDSQTVPGGTFDYTLAQQAKDKALNQLDQFKRGVQQFFERELPNLPGGFVNKMEADAKQKMSESPAALVTQGIANGLSAVAGAGGVEPPPASPGAVLVNSGGARQAANASLGATANPPPNVLASTGGDDSATTGSSGNDSNVTKRPTPPQSEKDVGTGLGSDFRPQVSYKDGQEVPYGTKGSVRPDWCNATSCSVEVKNYNIENNSSGLIKNVADQAIQRQANLPAGMEQQIVIDVRGQKVTAQQEDIIVKGIVSRSNGAIKPDAIEFKR
ncbi:hemagglutinin, partial [Ralstonia solanacearum]|uniref:hemagglutinin repeat-containing protein n=1 Tax=Ralstonia solanacearum TaxID=305 RepID=UPI0007D86C32